MTTYDIPRSERREACKAYDAMTAARPLKPPPLPRYARTKTAGERALARDIKLGLVDV